VHALVGANGAGKSTLGKVIGGVVRPDDGELFVDGRAVKYGTPREARDDGIATIAQELALAPAMSVMENVFLGIEPRRAGIVSRRRMRKQYAELISRSGFELDRDATVGSLRTADRQKVEILRAVNTDARLIVMDEPTSSLTSVETQALHKMTRSLRDQGKTIVYVSHFLDECSSFGDTVTVMRNGHVVRTGPASEETEESLVAGMFGQRPKPRASTSLRPRAPRSCSRSAVCAGGTSARHLADGPPGRDRRPRRPGRKRPVRARPRDRRRRSDRRREDLRRRKERRIRSPAHALAVGIAFLTEERKKDGLFMELSLAANTTFADVPPCPRAASCGGESSATGHVSCWSRSTSTRRTPALGQQPVGRQPAEGPVCPLAVP